MSGFVEWDDHEVLMALQYLQQSVGNLSPALREIGETLKESAQQRFSRKTSPGGQAWLGNSDLTIEFITTKRSGCFQSIPTDHSFKRGASRPVYKHQKSGCFQSIPTDNSFQESKCPVRVGSEWGAMGLLGLHKTKAS